MTLIITANTGAAYVEANAQPFVMYQNLLATGTVASANLPTGAPRSNAYDPATDVFYKPTSVPDTLRATFGSAQACDCAFFGAHTLGTAGATLTAQYFDGTTWQTQATYTPTTNQPFCFVWPTRSATGWGFQITGAVAQIGVAFMGPRIVIPGGVKPDYQPVWATRRITKTPGMSRRGHFQGQAIEMAGASLSPEFMDVPYDFANMTLDGFRTHYDRGDPFVFASAPSVFTRDVAYVWAPDNAVLGCPIRGGGYWTGLQMTLEAYAER